MCEENDNQEEVSDTVWQFAQAFQEMMEEYSTDFPEELSEQIANLSNQISVIDRKQKQTLKDFELIKQQLGKLTSDHKLLENAGEATRLLGQDYYDQRIIEPMMRSLFSVFDLIIDYCEHNSSKEVELAKSLYSQLQQFVGNYDIKVVRHFAGDVFNPKVMRPIKWEQTSEEHLDKSVAKSLQVGFKLGQSRILRMETVSLFRYEPSKRMLTNNILKG